MLTQELDEPEYGHLFVKRAVTRALDKHNHEREMSSILLSALYGEVGSAHVPCPSYRSKSQLSMQSPQLSCRFPVNTEISCWI